MSDSDSEKEKETKKVQISSECITHSEKFLQEMLNLVQLLGAKRTTIGGQMYVPTVHTQTSLLAILEAFKEMKKSLYDPN